jgi:hypothetical protein
MFFGDEPECQVYVKEAPVKKDDDLLSIQDENDSDYENYEDDGIEDL